MFMASSSSSNFLVPKDSRRKLPRPAGDIRYPLPSFTTSPFRDDLFIRSETYLGLTTTLRRSVKLGRIVSLPHRVADHLKAPSVGEVIANLANVIRIGVYVLKLPQEK